MKFVPVRYTVVATTAGGLKRDHRRRGRREHGKLLELFTVSTGVTTPILPVVAPPGTLVEICVLETAVKGAGVPLNVPLKPK